MRRAVRALMVPLVVLLLNSWPASACGDKLLILGLGVRYDVDSAAYPARILLYGNPELRSEPFKDAQLQSIVEKAGHRLRSVNTREELVSVLKTGRYDLVLADFADAVDLEQLVQSAPSNPMLLPWVYEPTKEQKTRAEKQYQWVLKAPASVGRFLTVIDQTMEKKQKLAKALAKGQAKSVSLLR